MPHARRSPVPVELPSQVQHGTNHAYCIYRCGCDACRAAANQVTRDRRARLFAERVRRRGRWYAPNAPQHGTKNAYNTYGCRCAPCTAARHRGELLATSVWAERNGVGVRSEM